MNELSYVAAFVGGLLSFFSPCIFPLIPVYLSLCSGISVFEINHKGNRIRIIVYTLIFISGFSSVYLVMAVGSSFLVGIFYEYQNFLRVISGVLLVLFGVLLLKVLKIEILLRDIRFSIKLKKIGTPLGAFLVGIGFAAGWSPCIGPILGSILTYSSMSGDIIKSVKMLGMYCLGLAIPFLLSSLMIKSMIDYLRKYRKIFDIINYFIGGLLIILGLMIVSGIFPLST